MGLRFVSFISLLLILLSIFEVKIVGAYEDPSIKIMEDFSGYPIHEPRDFLSLSVDSQGLQKQVKDCGFVMGPATV